jgi:hypothetical protein
MKKVIISIETHSILRETDIADIVSIVEESFGNNEIESVHRLTVGDDDSKDIDNAKDETINEDAANR